MESTIGQTLDVAVPEMEQLVEALKNASWDRTKQRTVEHTSDIPVPQVMKELAEISVAFSQDRVRQRSVEQAVEIPTLSLAGEIIEMPVIRTQEKTRRVANPQVQHVVDTVDVENQSTLHVCRSWRRQSRSTSPCSLNWPRAFQQS